VEDQIREVAEPCPTEQTDLIADTVIGVRRTHKIDSGVLSNRERSREPVRSTLPLFIDTSAATGF
jgi:hypothetical protein